MRSSSQEANNVEKITNTFGSLLISWIKEPPNYPAFFFCELMPSTYFKTIFFSRFLSFVAESLLIYIVDIIIYFWGNLANVYLLHVTRYQKFERWNNELRREEVMEIKVASL